MTQPARMIKSRTVKRDDPTRKPAAMDPGTSGAAATGVARPRPRRALSLVDRLVRVPIGFLWLGVLVLMAVPVMIYMTVLYWIVRWTSVLFGRSRAPRADRPDREERVA
jgi:hypothetical protein